MDWLCVLVDLIVHGSLKVTVPEERTRAVLQTRDFLKELATSNPKSGVPEKVRAEAIRLLRHYPSSSDIEIAHMYAPFWYGPVDG